jgi:hypothetical protein
MKKTRLENVHVLCPKRDICDNLRPVSVYISVRKSKTWTETGRKRRKLVGNSTTKGV